MKGTFLPLPRGCIGTGELEKIGEDQVNEKNNNPESTSNTEKPSNDILGPLNFPSIADTG